MEDFLHDITILERPREILYIGYNYNSSYFLLGTDIGFQVHNTYPQSLKFCRRLNGGIGFVQILNKSNIFCLVGGGDSPKYAPNKLLIWDDKKRKEIYEFRFNSFVLNCFIKLKYLFAICQDTINIISMQTMKTVETILTIDNPSGVGTISSAIDKYILSWPDLAKGKIAIKDFSELKSSSITFSVSSNDNNSLFKKKLSLKAHESGIAFLKLNNDGSKLATASIRGNIIRIFDTINGKIIQELKRGNGDSNIYSINFSYDNNFIGLTSDHGTAHIFLLNKNIKEINNVLARSSQIFEDEEENKNNKKEINNKDNKDNNNNDFNIIEDDKKNDLNDFNIIEDPNDKKDNKDKDKEDKKKEADNDNFEIINEDLVSSDVLEKKNKNQKSILSGVSKIMGFNSIFQNEWSFASFKISYKKESFISFIEGDKNNNKVIVIDKLGTYTAAEITPDKNVKTNSSYLI